MAKQNRAHRTWIESMKTRFPACFKHGGGKSEHLSRFSFFFDTVHAEILQIPAQPYVQPIIRSVLKLWLNFKAHWEQIYNF